MHYSHSSCKYARVATTPHMMLYLWLHNRIGHSATVAIHPPPLPFSSYSRMRNLDGWMTRRMDGWKASQRPLIYVVFKIIIKLIWFYNNIFFKIKFGSTRVNKVSYYSSKTIQV
jgi:hypothetical protein